jgi:DNA-binding transcriptional ArsR family regulator
MSGIFREIKRPYLPWFSVLPRVLTASPQPFPIPPAARISDVAEPFPMSLTGFCKHVRVLERAGLVRRTRQGRESTVELSPEPLRDVARRILRYEQFWNARLDRLQAFFATQKERSP